MNLFTKAAGLCGMILALLPGRLLAEAKPALAASVAGPQSVFINNPGFGKDPFFPKSSHSTRQDKRPAGNPRGAARRA